MSVLLALALALAWGTYPPQLPPGGATLFEVAAWIVEPVVLPCSDPEAGDCIVSYLRTWESPPQQLPLTATLVEWTAPELVSRGVAYMSVSACNDSCCDTSPGQVK